MNKATLIVLLIAGHAFAGETYVYPAKGQSAEEQKKDQFECYQWAAEQSGFDPVAASNTVESQAPAPKPEAGTESGGMGKSALGGAAKGAVIAEASDGDAGKGAATGATLGVLKGKRKKQKQQAVEAEQQAAAAERARVEAEAKQRQLRQGYERANAACLEGRGYTVK